MRDGEKISTFCSYIMRIGDRVRKTFHDSKYKDRWSARKMALNEAGALALLHRRKGVQQLEKIVDNTVVSEYAGHRLRKTDMSYEHAMKQGMAIVDVLQACKVVHRDIRPENLVCKHSQITLIDFQWACYSGCIFSGLDDAPREMGGKYRSMVGINDRHSMEMAIREIYK